MENTRATGLPCPHCAVDLVMSERQGIEIDYCPKCRGVWLDRGELDKIIERNVTESDRSGPIEGPGYGGGHSGGHREAGHGGRGGHGGQRGKHDSFLSRLFD